MARLTIVDAARAASLYADLDAGMAARTDVTVGHNTRLVRRDGAGPWGRAIALRLHYTDVATMYENGTVTFGTGGYHTVTTIERINHIARLLGLRAYRKNSHAYINGCAIDGFVWEA